MKVMGNRKKETAIKKELEKDKITRDLKRFSLEEDLARYRKSWSLLISRFNPTKTRRY